MTLNDKVTTVADDYLQAYNEAVQTYGVTVALTALAYASATAVHQLEHSIEGENVAAIATGTWVNSFHRLLEGIREACAKSRARGLN